MAKRSDPIREAGLLRKLNTPVGVAQWLHIESPDFEFDKFGAFKVKLYFDPNKPTVASMMQKLDELLEEALEFFTSKAKTPRDAKKVRASDNTPYYYEEDENGEQTGRIYMNPKMISSGITDEGEEWSRKLPIFDANGVRVTGKINAGQGTELKAALELRPYYNAQNGVGISLRLQGVQIAKLKAFGGGVQTAEDAGFGKIEGGYQADAFENVEAAEDEEAPITSPDDDSNGDY